jgi:hypothetical protein
MFGCFKPKDEKRTVSTNGVLDLEAAANYVGAGDGVGQALSPSKSRR